MQFAVAAVVVDFYDGEYGAVVAEYDVVVVGVDVDVDAVGADVDADAADVGAVVVVAAAESFADGGDVTDIVNGGCGADDVYDGAETGGGGTGPVQLLLHETGYCG